jgi:high-affinity iron transporter
VLSEDSTFGDVLHSFFGYSDAPTPLQLLIYVGYLAIVVIVYLGVRGRRAARADRSADRSRAAVH